MYSVKLLYIFSLNLNTVLQEIAYVNDTDDYANTEITTWMITDWVQSVCSNQ